MTIQVPGFLLESAPYAILHGHVGDITALGVTIKCMLLSDSANIDQQSWSSKADVTGEITAIGYTAGGVTASAGTLYGDTVSSAGWSVIDGSCRYALFYADIAGVDDAKPLIALVDFGKTLNLSSGLVIYWDVPGDYQCSCVNVFDYELSAPAALVVVIGKSLIVAKKTPQVPNPVTVTVSKKALTMTTQPVLVYNTGVAPQTIAVPKKALSVTKKTVFVDVSGSPAYVSIAVTPLHLTATPSAIQVTSGTVFNVKNYGAVGDNSHDDSANIQAAVNACTAGGTVYFPAGTYKVTYNAQGDLASIKLKSNINVLMDANAEVKLATHSASSYYIFWLGNIHDVTVTGGTITGYGTTGEFGYGIAMYNCHDITLNGVKSQYNQGDGSIVDGNNASTSYNIYIYNCNGDHNRRQGLTILDCGGGTIQNNYFQNTNGTSPASGIDLEPYASGQVIEHMIIDNNHCINNGVGGLGCGIVGSASTAGSTVANNTITNNVLTGNAQSGIGLDECDHFTIEGNTCTGNGTDGISLFGVHDFTIDGSNVCSSNARNGIYLSKGGWEMGSTYCYNVGVHANTCNSNTSYGVDVVNGTHDCQVTYNTIVGNGSGLIGTYNMGANNVLTPNNAASGFTGDVSKKSLTVVEKTPVVLPAGSIIVDVTVKALGVSCKTPTVTAGGGSVTEYFYPDPHTEVTSVDGSTSYDWVGGTWAAVRAADGNFFSDDSDTNNLAQIAATTNSGKWWNLSRSMMLFDTSSLPDGATIDSATLSIEIDSKTCTLATTAAAVVLVSSSPASNIALANGDHDTYGTTHLAADIAYANIPASGAMTFTLNAGGLAAISKVGVTKFGVRFICDCDNVEPAWGSGNSAKVTFRTAEWGGTAHAPKLSVTYH